MSDSMHWAGGGHAEGTALIGGALGTDRNIPIGKVWTDHLIGRIAKVGWSIVGGPAGDGVINQKQIRLTKGGLGRRGIEEAVAKAQEQNSDDEKRQEELERPFSMRVTCLRFGL